MLGIEAALAVAFLFEGLEKLVCGLKDGLAVGVVAVGVIDHFLENGSGFGADDANSLNEFGVAIRAIQALGAFSAALCDPAIRSLSTGPRTVRRR